MDTSNILKLLVETPSPCGYEDNIQTKISDILTPFVDSIELDVQGNLIAYKYSKSQNAKTLMLVAHADEIGLMVQHIEDNGYIRFSKIGGIDVQILKGRKIIVLHDGAEVPGVIGVRPIHMENENSKSKLDISDLWIDVGTCSKSETESFISVGDPILLASSYTALNNDMVSGRACDDKAGIAAVIKSLSILNENQYKCQYNIAIVLSVQEEVGSCGATIATNKIKPDIGIAIDMTHATDYPTINRAKYGEIGLGKGVVIPIGTDLSCVIQKKMKQIAKQNDIMFQPQALPGHSLTDAHAVHIANNGCMSGLLSIPCRYMHSPIEVVSLNDIDYTARLLAEFCHNISDEQSI